jgi:hypothetical protein
MLGKSKVVLKKHLFNEKPGNNIQTLDYTWTVRGPHTDWQEGVYVVYGIYFFLSSRSIQNEKNTCANSKS